MSSHAISLVIPAYNPAYNRAASLQRLTGADPATRADAAVKI
jgi:hypothetical protein